MHALTCVRDAGRFDVVSDHTGALGLALSNLTSTPFLNTVHGTLAGEAGALYRRVCELTPAAALVALTESHRATRRRPALGRHDPECDRPRRPPVRAQPRRRVPLLARPHVGRQGPGDGDRGRARGRHADAAGRQAARRGRAGATSSTRCEPRLGGGIEYVGEIDLHERVRLLHGARALVNPLAWDEPFGLVMVEAMACGVPVIATPRGSVPEIVVDGQTGWIAATVDGMAAAVERCDEIDPRECRAVAEFYYSPERMVADYVDAFHGVIGRASRESARAARPA